MRRAARTCAGFISGRVSLAATEQPGWAAASAALQHQDCSASALPSVQQEPVWTPLSLSCPWGAYPPGSCHHQRHGFSGVRNMSLWSLVTNWRKEPSTSSTSQAHGDILNDSAIQPEPQPPPDWPLPEDSSEALQAIIQATAAWDNATFAIAKHEAWFSSAWVMDGLQYLHTSYGLSWWSAIASLYLASRMLTFPLTVYGQKVAAKMSDYNDRVARMNVVARQAQMASDPQEAHRLQKAIKSEVALMKSEHGSLPMLMGKQLGTMVVNMFVFLSIFNGVRTLLGAEMQTLRVGGTLWFSDLTIPDPYYGLPVLCALTTAGMVYRGMNAEGSNMSMDPNMQRFQKPLTYFAYLMSFMFIPAGGMLPAGVAVLWATGACWGIAQGFVVRAPQFRQAFGLPSMQELADRKKRHAATQAATAPSAEAAGAYDPAKAAEELMQKVQRDEAGRPVLFTHNPAAAGGVWQPQQRVGSKVYKARRR